MVEDKINLFLEELQKRCIEINGETAFICKDGAVLFIPNENGGVDIMLVRNPVHIDYELGITEEEMELWKTTADLMQELGD